VGAAAALILTAALAAAGGGEHGAGEHHFNMFEYVSTVTNFVVMFGFLAYVLKQPIASFLETRRENMDTDRAIERMAREADFTIKQEVRKAEKAIREAAATATLEAAEMLIKERITEADQRRLADNYISSLGTKATMARR
jgi:F0F1-type ATP synthase membrane subunit b/b'